jgi:twitching motility protein PilT
MTKTTTSTIGSTLLVPDAAPIEGYLNALWEANGSDLLLTVGSAPLMRVDGLLRPVPHTEILNEADTERLVSGVLGQALAARFRTEKQVDFGLSWRDRGRLRGNAFLQRGSVALALRLIPFVIPTFEELGIPSLVHEWVRAPRGFLLVTGPTGSGKTTTLASMIDEINSHKAVHILTIEDPVEYLHMHKRAAVSQREVGSDTDSFASALRAALREDPDVVLVGEMRDPESIATALTIAETGHLVLATLHTNDTAQTLDRILDVFPAAQQAQIRLQLTHTLIGILNQHLVPRIGGGRVAAFEVMVATNATRNLIREGKSRQIRNLVAMGRRDGMATLEDSLSQLVARGVVSYEDAVACTTHTEDIKPPPPSAHMTVA